MTTATIQFITSLVSGDLVAALPDDYDGPRSTGARYEFDPATSALISQFTVVGYDGSNLTLQPVDGDVFTLHLVDPMDIIALVDRACPCCGERLDYPAATVEHRRGLDGHPERACPNFLRSDHCSVLDGHRTSLSHMINCHGYWPGGE